MCGRTACTLSPANIRRACQYRDRKGQIKEPTWRDAPDGGEYRPSANIPPTAYTPVLLVLPAKEKDKDEEERILQPMMWGLVPPWHQGSDPKSHKLCTNNARLEGVQKSNLYRACLHQRCVVLCDGFYEWKRDGPVKQPYLVYARQKPGVKIESCLEYSQDPDHPMNEGSWSGPELLQMAGLYSVWRAAGAAAGGGGGPPVYSYTVLTRDSGSVLGWMHDRIPCLLTTDAAVATWLDPDTPVPAALALLQLPPADSIAYHPVSTAVGSVKNQDLTLVLPVEPADTKESPSKKKKVLATAASQNMMSSWLRGSKEQKKEEETAVIKQEESVSSPQHKKPAKSGSQTLMASWLKKKEPAGQDQSVIKDEKDEEAASSEEKRMMPGPGEKSPLKKKRRDI